ncbi:MAG: glutaredoxin domain-containing protein [bacterium]|nr:glutaredoxin domain-containing protein [bacterium]
MPEQICVYGTDWCPDTARTRKCLAKLGIDYTWHNIDKDKDACAFVEEVNNGNRSVPTILFPDGSIFVEPSDAELEKKCRG